MALSEDAIADAACSMGIDVDEVALRKAYLELDEQDRRLLTALHTGLGGADSSAFVEAFYSHLLSFEQTRELLPDEGIVERLRHAQRQYFDRLLSGPYDWSYVLDRLKVGLVHDKVGLEPKWYLGAYSQYLTGLIPHIQELYAEDTEQAFRTLGALTKIIFFDIGFSLDAYFHAGQQSIVKLKGYAEQIVRCMPTGLAVLDVDLNLLSANAAFRMMFGLGDMGPAGTPLDSYLEIPDIEQRTASVLETGEHQHGVLVSKETGKETRHFKLSLSPTTLNDRPAILLMVEDFTERKNALEVMQTLSSVTEQSAESILMTDKNGVITYVNPTFEQVTGFSAQEVIGKTPAIVKSDKHGGEFYERLWKTLQAGDAFSEVFINRRKDGELYYEQKTITPLKNEAGEITSYVSNGLDITERMQVQEHFHYLANHDAVTDLPNRVLLMERVEQALIRARWNEHSVCLLFLDIDRFKGINDALGHAAGDQLLKEVSGRLIGIVREGDTVARLGGDEFGILLDDIASPDDIPPIADKLLGCLAEPFQLAGQELFITGSIGISCYPDDGSDQNTLLKHADVALSRAKDAGKNNYRFYSKGMSARALQRMTLETKLRRALEKEEFVLHYQPQVTLGTGNIIGVEALIRWQNPEIGLVSPLEFIPLLEETGLIIPVGDWVMRAAVDQCEAWNKGGSTLPRISINVSARQLGDPDLVRKVSGLLEACSVPAGHIELEITESVVMKDPERSIGLLHDFRAMGLRLAIDDFGTGYSSLSYLKRLPIDTLKIDRSFVMDIDKNSDSAAIASAILSLAGDLGMEVVAEGVETTGQLDFLRAKACDYIQGYLFSRPVPGDELGKMLGEGKTLSV